MPGASLVETWLQDIVRGSADPGRLRPVINEGTGDGQTPLRLDRNCSPMRLNRMTDSTPRFFIK